jgi:hydrogenase expression/formation protein HypD
MNIFRFGLRDLLPGNIELVSGPGCPVCVTPNAYVDKAIKLAEDTDAIIATFGDMIKVPGSHSSLEKARGSGVTVKTVYSCMDALTLAKKYPSREVVFLGVGFETTAPTVARTILAAKRGGVENFSVLCGHKTMPEALKVLAEDPKLKVDGFLLPGHVSAVIGSKPYEFLCRKHRLRCAIAGFEPLDILEAIYMIVAQSSPKVSLEYSRIVARRGNTLAQGAIRDVFEKTASTWRGMGEIADSGLKIRRKFSGFDAERKFRIGPVRPKEDRRCMCGEVLKGVKIPPQCRLFGRLCRPESPVGACMVSSEGTCAAYFKYSRSSFPPGLSARRAGGVIRKKKRWIK